jgi:hypothetical protein
LKLGCYGCAWLCRWSLTTPNGTSHFTQHNDMLIGGSSENVKRNIIKKNVNHKRLFFIVLTFLRYSKIHFYHNIRMIF